MYAWLNISGASFIIFTKKKKAIVLTETATGVLNMF